MLQQSERYNFKASTLCYVIHNIAKVTIILPKTEDPNTYFGWTLRDYVDNLLTCTCGARIRQNSFVREKKLNLTLFTALRHVIRVRVSIVIYFRGQKEAMIAYENFHSEVFILDMFMVIWLQHVLIPSLIIPFKRVKNERKRAETLERMWWKQHEWWENSASRSRTADYLDSLR